MMGAQIATGYNLNLSASMSVALWFSEPAFLQMEESGQALYVFVSSGVGGDDHDLHQYVCRCEPRFDSGACRCAAGW